MLLEIKGGAVEGKVSSKEETKATLPNREHAFYGFSVLQSNSYNIAYAVKAVAEKKKTTA